MSTETLPAVVAATHEVNTSGYFGNIDVFADGQRMAKALAAADFVPKEFKDNIPNCLIALDMSIRLKANPLAVMQNIYMVHNKPSWSSQFLIACVNKSGLFKTPLRYRFSGKEGTDEYGCVAWAVDNSGETLESTKITMKMAKEEGWYGKNGSKWKSMPEQMLRYRAATFFARAYCPELTMGMMTNDEVRDTYDVEARPPEKQTASARLSEVLKVAPPGDSKESETIDVEPSETDEDSDDWFERERKALEPEIEEGYEKWKEKEATKA
jgi:hypothetical protein